MWNRIQRTGLNLTVLIVSILVFLGAFALLIALANASKPQSLDVLSAARDLNAGDVIGPADLAVKSVYVDSNTSLYIPADQQADVAGGIVAVPIYAGQPVFKTSIVAPAGAGARISAILARNPGYGLFPLPLDRSNVAAPSAQSFMPGDLVDVTLVISNRPQPIETPTALPTDTGNADNPGATALPPLPLPLPTATESAEQAAEARIFPPVAKSLLPGGVRVIAVQGLPPATTDQSALTGSLMAGTNSAASAPPSTYADYSQPKILLLMVPVDQIEPLALALQEGDLVIVTLLAKGSDKPTAGFTYWDLEQLILSDRRQGFGQ